MSGERKGEREKVGEKMKKTRENKGSGEMGRVAVERSKGKRGRTEKRGRRKSEKKRTINKKQKQKIKKRRRDERMRTTRGGNGGEKYRAKGGEVEGTRKTKRNGKNERKQGERLSKRARRYRGAEKNKTDENKNRNIKE